MGRNATFVRILVCCSVAPLVVPGQPDFIISDGHDVWLTDQILQSVIFMEQEALPVVNVSFNLGALCHDWCRPDRLQNDFYYVNDDSDL